MKSSPPLLPQKLRQQFHKTPWLKWAMLLIGVLLALHSLHLLQAALKAAQLKAISQEERLRQVQSLRGQEIWLIREQESEKVLEGLTASIPTAPTAGVAQAALQGWLSGLGNSISNTQSVRISVEPGGSVESLSDVIRIRATLRGAMSAREALNVARQIESARDLVVIESADIRSDTNQLASFGINAYYRISSDDPTGESP